ncbi:MAG: methyltransferase [Deltaproteobacteria bacterium]|nr:methyltransferase [Deltaproteobacteria bacterium]
MKLQMKEMPSPVKHPLPKAEALAYLCVDEFMKTLIDAGGLAAAFELGLIDYLVQNSKVRLDDLRDGLAIDAQGLRFLLDLLMANHVIEMDNGDIGLTPAFLRALKFRDLLEAKLEFSRFVAPDMVHQFTALIRSFQQFGRDSRTFELFCYGRSLENSPENFKLTKRWVRITTALTKYEAQVCLQYHDFSRYRRMLDIGGNSGEFALRVCKAHPDIQATVFDLPVVCDVGLAHVEAEPEAGRICFVKGNALADPLPKGFDLIAFKSMLHDWPEKEAKQLIAKAKGALAPGGTLLIFERGPIEVGEKTPPYSMISFLLFFRSFRSPEIYRDQLKASGFSAVAVRRIDLEMPFFLITGTNA